MKATITNARLLRIDDVWKKHKPQGLGFSDNDAVVVEMRTSKGKVFSNTFYCRLKADGTLGHSITKASEKRQQLLRAFVERYISKNKRYNIRGKIESWAGKEVEVELVNGQQIITI